jgi:hypothetical protein
MLIDHLTDHAAPMHFVHTQVSKHVSASDLKMGK